MSERIYALLLHLYPSRFREAYGDEALLLFRDRARDERGTLPGLRFWLDLLADLVVSIPRAYRHAPESIGVSAHERFAGAPSFQVLEGEPPRPRALFSAASLSLVFFSAVPILMVYGGNDRPLHVLEARLQNPGAALSFTSRRQSQRPRREWRRRDNSVWQANDGCREFSVRRREPEQLPNNARPRAGRPKDYPIARRGPEAPGRYQRGDSGAQHVQHRDGRRGPRQRAGV